VLFAAWAVKMLTSKKTSQQIPSIHLAAGEKGMW